MICGKCDKEINVALKLTKKRNNLEKNVYLCSECFGNCRYFNNVINDERNSCFCFLIKKGFVVEFVNNGKQNSYVEFYENFYRPYIICRTDEFRNGNVINTICPTCSYIWNRALCFYGVDEELKLKNKKIGEIN